MAMDKVCANCMWCVIDTCEFQPEGGKKRKMYVGKDNYFSGCSDCFTKEEWDKEIEREEL